MSKSVLVIDTPKNCLECIMLTETHDCIMQDKEANYIAYSYTKLREGCPLREMPEKKNFWSEEHGGKFSEGWNACIAAITGERYGKTDTNED